MWGYVLLVIGVVIVAAILCAPRLADRLRRRESERAKGAFRLQREMMEARFFDMAAASGKPRGVRWIQCDWQPSVTFARERATGLITAFASVNVSFEAIEGSDMEEVEHVGLLRDGCALFHYQQGQWGTGGRVLFNMNPDDALTLFADQYAPLDQPGPLTRPPVEQWPSR
ncbi:MAG: hypothetical protein R3C01_03165 [Planctomycetaceae bacterium]